eukprot:3428647-Alexandrium_andersonii.AAC.1
MAKGHQGKADLAEGARWAVRQRLPHRNDHGHAWQGRLLLPWKRKAVDSVSLDGDVLKGEEALGKARQADVFADCAGKKTR